MGMSWENAHQFIRMGESDYYALIYKAGCVNDTAGEDYEFYRSENRRVFFTSEEWFSIIKTAFNYRENLVLKRKSRSADFYQEGELVKKLLNKLHSKHHLNILPNLTPTTLTRYWNQHLKIGYREVTLSPDQNYYTQMYHDSELKTPEEVQQFIENYRSFEEKNPSHYLHIHYRKTKKYQH